MIKGIYKSMKNIGAKPEMLNKSWSKEDVIEELPEGWKRVEGALTAPNGYIVVSNNKSRFGGDRETKLLKQAKPAIDKKKFIEMVYDYGASGDKTLEGLNDNQKQAIASAWSTFQAEDEENETDEKFGSFYSDFMGK